MAFYAKASGFLHCSENLFHDPSFPTLLCQMSHESLWFLRNSTALHSALIRTLKIHLFHGWSVLQLSVYLSIYLSIYDYGSAVIAKFLDLLSFLLSF